MKCVVAGIEPELAAHYGGILDERRVSYELRDSPSGTDLYVDDADADWVNELLGSPFEGDEFEEGALPAVRALDPDERLEVLVRTDDAFAANRLARLLEQAKIFVAVDAPVAQPLLTIEGPPSLVLRISERDHEKAWSLLEAYAATHAHDFSANAAGLTPQEMLAVVVRLLIAGAR